MSAHFSKFSLNTWPGTPYFQAHVPGDYPLSLVLQASRAFRRLPPNLKRLAVLSREWGLLNSQTVYGIDEWYDSEGNELDPDTGRRLTDAEIDAEWDSLGWPVPDGYKDMDIPVPAGGFPSPGTWEPPPIPLPDDEENRPSQSQLLSDIASRGRKATSEEYGIPLEQLPGYSPDTVEEREGEDWDVATERFKRRAKRVMDSQWMRDRPKDRKLVAAALKKADMKWDLAGDAEAYFDLAEDHI